MFFDDSSKCASVQCLERHCDGPVTSSGFVLEGDDVEKDLGWRGELTLGPVNDLDQLVLVRLSQ